MSRHGDMLDALSYTIQVNGKSQKEINEEKIRDLLLGNPVLPEFKIESVYASKILQDFRKESFFAKLTARA